jgi:hypothetical protein
MRQHLNLIYQLQQITEEEFIKNISVFINNWITNNLKHNSNAKKKIYPEHCSI